MKKIVNKNKDEDSKVSLKEISGEKIYRNPLNRICGEIIRRSRVEANKSKTYEQFSKHLNIGVSYLKSVEIGIFPISPINAISLYNVWQNETKVGSNYKSFKLEGIIQLLSIISILESHAQENIRRKRKAIIIQSKKRILDH